MSPNKLAGMDVISYLEPPFLSWKKLTCAEMHHLCLVCRHHRTFFIHWFLVWIIIYKWFLLWLTYRFYTDNIRAVSNCLKLFCLYYSLTFEVKHRATCESFNCRCFSAKKNHDLNVVRSHELVSHNIRMWWCLWLLLHYCCIDR